MKIKYKLKIGKGMEIVKNFFFLSLCVTLAAMPLLAQESDDADELEPFVVVGSNIATDIGDPQVKVDIFTESDIADSGAETLSQFIRKQPFAVGSGNSNETRSNGGNGAAGVDLRGLGGGTLVLINGRRPGIGGIDLNLVPLAAVERVEIQKDGASALYGSDAIAGVVNIVFKQGFSGTIVDLGYGNTTDTDVGQQSYSFVTGLSDEKTSILIGGSYYSANALYSVDRGRSFPSFTQTSIHAYPGAFEVRNDALGGGNFYDPTIYQKDADGNPLLNDAGENIIDGAAGVLVTLKDRVNPSAVKPVPGDYREFKNNRGDGEETDRFPYAYYTPSKRPSERYNFFGNSESQITDSLTFFTEAMYSYSYSYNQFAPSPFNSNSVGSGGDPLVIPKDNFYNPFDQDISGSYTWFYRSVELGPRTEEVTRDYYRFLGGFKGDIGDSGWSWESAWLYNENRALETLGGELSRSALQEAIADTGELAFNPFGHQIQTDAQLGRLGQTLTTNTKMVLQSFDVRLNGSLFDLPAGTVALAAGYEHRYESYESVPDKATQSGDTVGFNSGNPLYGDRDIDSGFAEIFVPIASGSAGLNELSATVAGRVDQYSDFGSDFNPLLNLKWKPIDDQLTIRASYSQSYVAPSFGNLYTVDQQSYPEVWNPALQDFDQVSAIYSGNPNLDPHTADTYTAGFVYQPDFVEGLTVAVTYFRIEQEGVPGGSSQHIIDENYRTSKVNAETGEKDLTTGTYSELVSFDPDSKRYKEVKVPTLNLSKVEADGLDFEVSYVKETDDYGTFVPFLSATYITTFDKETIPGSGMKDYLDRFSTDDFGFGSIPDLKGYVGLDWSHEKIGVGVTVNYLSSYEDGYLAYGADAPGAAGVPDIDSFVSLDLRLSYQLPFDVMASVGVLNVTDEEPPYSRAAFADNYDRDMHDPRQRFVYFNLKKIF